MTHLEELKDAMHSPPDFQPAELDLQQVMTSGGRMRRRRRFAVGGASALTVAALLIGFGQLAGPERPVSSVAAPAPSAGGSSAPGVVGTIAETGRQAGDRRWILYFETSAPNDLDESLTLVLGRTASGTIDDFDREIESSEPGTDRTAPGFHSVEPGRVLDGRTTPTFGYYVGDAARITARDTTTGTIVEAERVPWSAFGEPAEAQIFWFGFTDGRPAAGLTDITAYDEKGTRLHTAG